MHTVFLVLNVIETSVAAQLRAVQKMLEPRPRKVPKVPCHQHMQEHCRKYLRCYSQCVY